MNSGLRVVCSLKNCVYHRPVPSTWDSCFCVHPDKTHYLGNTTCPLYRAQWDSQAEAALVERFAKKRR